MAGPIRASVCQSKRAPNSSDPERSSKGRKYAWELRLRQVERTGLQGESMISRLRFVSLSTLLALASSCGGGGGGGGTGAMFAVSCNLGCGSGTGGGQVGCSFTNTPQNQEIAIEFSRPISGSSVTGSSFQVTDVTTGLSAPGTYLLDPANSNRVIFRPQLEFDTQGNAILGFEPNATYRIFLPGTTLDSGPFITSVAGQRNQSRVQCQITTDQGIADTVPGPPTSSPFVEVFGIGTQPADGATEVELDSPITVVFNDLMNIATLVTPSTGQAPFIDVLVDEDGNLGTEDDQSELSGAWTFDIDEFALTTTIVFTPTGGLPTAGEDPNAPRRVILRLPASLSDLSGNGLSDPRDVVFVPRMIVFPPASIVESFNDQALRDPQRSGGDWGVQMPGRLQPADGGGSGRHGDFIVRTGQTRVLATSPVKAEGSITFLRNLVDPMGPPPGDINSQIELGIPGETTTFAFNTGASNPMGNPPTVQMRPFVSYTVNELLWVIDQRIALMPGTSLERVDLSYEVIDYETSQAAGQVRLRIRLKNAGAAGNQGGAQEFFFDARPSAAPAGPNPFSLEGDFDNVSGMTFLEGGSDGETFLGLNSVNNFDFQADPGGMPPPLLVDNGIFEFNRVVVEAGATLRIRGSNPGQLFARGLMRIEGTIDVSGESKLEHPSDSLDGQIGGAGGPAAGSGGSGGLREESAPGPDSLLNISGNDNNGFFRAGVANNPGLSGGGQGGGVGGVGFGGQSGGGGGGLPWPIPFPLTIIDYGEFKVTPFTDDLDATLVCTSAQIGGPGGGAGYVFDGTAGIPDAQLPTSHDGSSNVPSNTAMGEGVPINATVRLLRPGDGNLRGGAGGGGGGGSIELTRTTADLVADCFIGAITHYRNHSGAAGGGGGGGLLANSGDRIIINGFIDASGGDGGRSLSMNAMNAFNARSAAPGGGGSGGGVLVQTSNLTLGIGSPRISVDGGLGGLGKQDPAQSGNQSTGGNGSMGLVRIETNQGLTNGSVEDSILPDVPDSSVFLSVGDFAPTGDATDGPAVYSAVTSCWYRPATTDNFFSLDFEEDDLGASTFGWDLMLTADFGLGPVTVPYRAPNGIIATSFQEDWGDLLGPDSDLPGGQDPAPIVVRFQGAKTSGALTNPCIDDPFAAGVPFVLDSVTPWVRHPAELNVFQPKPDTIRFVIIFDRSSVNFGGLIGVEEIRIDAQPE
jgi:hypothetical protein